MRNEPNSQDNTQLRRSSATSDASPLVWASVPARETNNLPAQVTSFIGRASEITAVKDLLSTARLVTLTGAGGCGKTRLALRVAHDLVESYADGVWLVELAPLSDPKLVPQAVAAVLDVPEQPGQPVLDTLVNYMRSKHLLLVLDNCEHVIEACARLADTLLRACPDLSILATSRESLGIVGESGWTVPSLSLPDVRQPLPSLADLSHSEAVQLFVARAGEIKSNFALNQLNSSAVSQICQRLDGIPLAIELAAARVKVLQPAEIATRLDDRFSLLTVGSRTAIPRHQTLRAAIDWSYDLLSEPERVLLRRLAVFAGGWTLEAAEQVCTDEETLDGISPAQVLDLLSHLVDKSLVLVQAQGGSTRYHMLETIREYAFEKLNGANETDLRRTRHLDFFVSFAEHAEPEMKRAQQLEWFERLDAEIDNFRASLAWSLGQGRVEKGLRLAGALLRFWDMRGYWSEGSERVERLLIQPEAAPRTLTRANALLAAAELAGSLGASKRAVQYLQELIAIARDHGTTGKRTLALGLAALSDRIFIADQVRAESLVEEGLTIARSTGDAWLIGSLLYQRGFLLTGRKEDQAAREALEESLMLFKSAGDLHGAAAASYHASRIYFREGDWARARQEREASLPFLRQAKDRRYVWFMVNGLGEIARAEGNYDLAKGFYDEGLELARELGAKFQMALATANAGYVALYDGKVAYAQALFAESLELAREVDYGGTTACALLGFAGVAAASKNARRAVQLLSAVNRMLTEGDRRIFTPADEAEYRRHLAIAREQLDDAVLNAAWEQGRALTLEQAIEYALEMPLTPEPGVPHTKPPQVAKKELHGLTARERQVAARIAQGMSNREIAEALVVSERTIESHVTNILNKLGFTTRAQIRKWAQEKGLGGQDS